MNDTLDPKYIAVVWVRKCASDCPCWRRRFRVALDDDGTTQSIEERLQRAAICWFDGANPVSKMLKHRWIGLPVPIEFVMKLVNICDDKYQSSSPNSSS